MLNREQTSSASEPLPAKLVAKDWRSLWQRKLNVAWLPPEQVFLRVAQFPQSDFDETLAMVELQLEKLSPMPVAQIVWSIHVLPHAEGNLQTVIVMIVSRNTVEEFLGQLEGQGYLADRLELPLLDQLQATTVTRNGAWIYPEAPGGRSAALVAWWYGGVLQNLDLITLPPANRPESLKEQLLQMAWAGELEGWLTAPPAWHLVADAADRRRMGAGLARGAGAAGRGHRAGAARRAGRLDRRARGPSGAAGEPAAGRVLHALPPAIRGSPLDARAGRGRGALSGGRAGVFRAARRSSSTAPSQVEDQVAERGPIYTNALQLKAKFQSLERPPGLEVRRPGLLESRRRAAARWRHAGRL